MTGSACSTTAAFPTEAFEVVAGATAIGGLHGQEARHHHCPQCFSWVFTRVEPDQGFVNVRATMFDDAGWFAPFMETYTSAALPWGLIGAPRAFREFPDVADYPALLEEYAAC